MFTRRPPGHVHAGLADQLQGCQCINPIDPRQVDARQGGQIGLDSKGEGITLACFPGWRHGRYQEFALAGQPLQARFNLGPRAERHRATTHRYGVLAAIGSPGHRSCTLAPA